MRILVLSQFYPPEPITRLRDLVSYLKQQGHQVSVLTTFPSYPLGQIYDTYQLKWRKFDWEADIPITRVFAWPYRGMNQIKRFLSYISFAIAALLFDLLPRLISRNHPELLYIYHPPLTTGLAGTIYALLAKVPVIYDVQDLWPDAIVAAGLLRSDSKIYRSLRRAEIFVYRHAKHITVLSDGMKENLMQKGVPANKISIISNWGDPTISQPQDVSDFRQQKGWDGRFVILLAGNIGMTHGLHTVIEAADLLRRDPSILFVFLGSGAALPELKTMAQTKKLDNVCFCPQVSQHEATKYINSADVTLVHLKAEAGGDFSVPHRIFSYMLCGKAIIAATSGSTANLIETYQCGWTCPPSKPDMLAHIIMIAQSHPEACAAFGKNGIVAANTEFSRSHLLAKIEQILRTVIDG